MRIDGPTPSGGAYAVAVYLRDLTTLEGCRGRRRARSPTPRPSRRGGSMVMS